MAPGRRGSDKSVDIQQKTPGLCTDFCGPSCHPSLLCLTPQAHSCGGCSQRWGPTCGSIWSHLYISAAQCYVPRMPFFKSSFHKQHPKKGTFTSSALKHFLCLICFLLPPFTHYIYLLIKEILTDHLLANFCHTLPICNDFHVVNPQDCCGMSNYNVNWTIRSGVLLILELNNMVITVH